jgi:hypothetical protein
MLRALGASAALVACSAAPPAGSTPRAAMAVTALSSATPARPVTATRLGSPLARAASTSLSPTFGPPAPEAVDPSLPLLADGEAVTSPELLVHALLGSSIAEAWTTSAGLFATSARASQASEVAHRLPYPPAAAEAAENGRVVVMTQVWRVTAGRLARVLETPTQLRPLTCIADEDCTIVELRALVSEDGAVVVDRAACPAALAELAPAQGPASTWDAYDRAALPAMCSGPARFAWNGRSFVGSPAVGAGAAAVHRVAPEQAATHLLEAVLGAPLAETSLQASPSSDGRHHHVLVIRRHPAAHHPWLSHALEARAWESGRAIEIAESWLAGYGSLRRTWTLPVGLTALAEDNVVARLPVELDGDEVRVGASSAEPCRAASQAAAEPARGAVDAAHARRDLAAVERICAGRGRYRFDGRSFTRLP